MRDVSQLLLCVNLLHDYRFSITAIQQLQNFSLPIAYELCALVCSMRPRPLAKDEYVTTAHEVENVVNNNNWNILHGLCPFHAAHTHTAR